jgi:DNA-binding response OmpR family regulator
MHISIIDDEKILAQRIQKKLENEGFAVSIFHGYKEFMQNGDARSKLYIIDISLWDGSGFEIITWLRANSSSKAPIMIISGYGDSEKVVYGLNIGADDYMIKPLLPDELIARVKALMRRPHTLISSKLLLYKDISYNPERHETRVWENQVYLTHKESMILELFLSRQWHLVSREELINSVWGWNKLSDVSDNTINVTLSKLRKKVGNNFDLKTIYNEGYIIE